MYLSCEASVDGDVKDCQVIVLEVGAFVGVVVVLVVVVFVAVDAVV